MIRRVLYFCLICQLFYFNNTEPLKGERVSKAQPREFPFIASLGLKNPSRLIARSHFCGGTLITRIHVLTAAHCLNKYEKQSINVIIGEEDLRTARFTYDIHWWIRYNNWAKNFNRSLEFTRNDVAIIKLTTYVVRPHVEPVFLSFLNDEQLLRKKVVIAGWGKSNQGKITDVLKKANVQILTREMYMTRIKLITNSTIYPGKNYLCTSADPYVLTASGDSGGPVLDKNNVLVGVIRGTCPNITLQWGNFSQEFINKYTVSCHSSVDYYRDYIISVMNIMGFP